MTIYSEFYEESLYPLQNGVLNIIKTLNVPFYLSGGTALSRGYYKHRYSDDLDFFVNKDPCFIDYTQKILETLENKGYIWDREREEIKNPDYVSLYVHRKENINKLKIDFVNDVEAHFGKIKNTDVYYRTDAVQNILSNKITALYRVAEKDVVDIHEIALHENFNWKEILIEANKKEVGLEVKYFVEILNSLPESAFNKIKWIKHYDYKYVKENLLQISDDLLKGSDNSLCN